MSLRKDATISSKMSEYDNVPVLPGNYHDYKDQHDLPVAPPHHLSSFPVDDPPPVPPHQGVSAGATLPPQPQQHAQLHPQQQYPQQYAQPQQQQYPQQQQQQPQQYPQQQQPAAPPSGRPLQFPTEQAPQQDYDSLDVRLVIQHQKQLLQQQEEQLQQQQQLQTGQKRTVVTTASKSRESERSHRQSYGGGEMSVTASLVFYFLVFLAEILMFGLLSLVLFWVVYYRGGFKWREDPAKEFNFHPVLMVAGFIFFMGHAMLVYRLFRCCNKLTAKLLHTFLYLLAVPCIVVGVITVFDSHNLRVPPIPNLYSLHSWLGLVTVGLFALQVTHTLVVGFFSFWLLLCCEQGTASFRSGLVPVHATFGIITFMLAIATCVTGYTEKAFFVLRDPETKNFTYSLMGNEAIIINTQAAALAALGILVPVMVALRPFRRRWSERLTEHL
ncbi:cytochrome b ascorbate-dependent protein 3-like isoform X3 [Penaeus monodon]|uniref:cytochrome b ascorbate-dependent protein 3-like isoform X3 n=1 Tax=Penaeus monodon TaxID=6687 RepID=UPI0018A70E8F|nr:cytochrome b ascorbate-dependent protein 3-like isoform X3 [Penaeus monodon]